MIHAFFSDRIDPRGFKLIMAEREFFDIDLFSRVSGLFAFQEVMQNYKNFSNLHLISGERN
jgi:hypothetical protein